MASPLFRNANHNRIPFKRRCVGTACTDQLIVHQLANDPNVARNANETWLRRYRKQRRDVLRAIFSAGKWAA